MKKISIFCNFQNKIRPNNKSKNTKKSTTTIRAPTLAISTRRPITIQSIQVPRRKTRAEGTLPSSKKKTMTILKSLKSFNSQRNFPRVSSRGQRSRRGNLREMSRRESSSSSKKIPSSRRRPRTLRTHLMTLRYNRLTVFQMERRKLRLLLHHRCSHQWLITAPTRIMAVSQITSITFMTSKSTMKTDSRRTIRLL